MKFSNKTLLVASASAALLQFATGVAQAYYKPQTGRWLSRDPVGEPGFQVLQAASGAPRAVPASADTALPAGRWFERDSEVLSGPSLYGFVFNSPLNVVDVLGLCPCKCKSVKGGPFQDSITHSNPVPNRLSVGVNVPWKVTVDGDNNQCQCKYIENGNIWGQVHFHGGPTLEQNKPFPNVVTDPIPCTYSNDRPGLDLGVPASGSLSYVIRYQLSVTLICQDEVGSGSASDTVNINALFMGGNLTWP